MSTAAIRRLIKSVQEADLGERTPARVGQAEDDVASIEAAAKAIIAWNEKGRPSFDLDAARAYDVLERIAKQNPT